MARRNVTITLADDVLAEVRSAARATETPYSHWIESVLRRHLSASRNGN